jgi:large conductance mechanosensitive channel
MLKGFRSFLLRGNIVDLAVAVVIGVAFNAVIQALVRDIITPLIAAIVGKPSFGSLSFRLHHSLFRYGDLINYMITFLAIAAAVYFLIVAPMNSLAARRKNVEQSEVVPEEIALLREIRNLLAASSASNHQ